MLFQVHRHGPEFYPLEDLHAHNNQGGQHEEGYPGLPASLSPNYQKL